VAGEQLAVDDGTANYLDDPYAYLDDSSDDPDGPSVVFHYFAPAQDPLHPAKGGRPIFVNLYTSFYWRIDDLPFDGKCKVKPRLSFYAHTGISFSLDVVAVDESGRAIVGKSCSGSRTSDVLNDFAIDLDFEAKYLSMTIKFRFDAADGSQDMAGMLHLSALPVEYERDLDPESLLIKGCDKREFDPPNHDIARLTRQLCLDCDVNVDEQSFEEVGDKLPKDANLDSERRESAISFIPFKHEDKFADKIAEICRAANFSVFSNGSKLHAGYFLSGESEWHVTPSDVTKGSLEIRGIDWSSIASEWNFSANVRGEQKTLSFAYPRSEIPSIPPPSNTFTAQLIYAGYMKEETSSEISGFGARVFFPADARELRVGGKYKVNVSGGQLIADCELVSLRVSGYGADALFAYTPPPVLRLQSEFTNGLELEITPLTEPIWREAVSGTLGTGIESVQKLWDISQAAFAKTKRRNKLDERYTKHQIAAFGSDELWLQSFINTARHNSYAKTIISFKVPLGRLPSGSLSSLLLRRATLAFGRFRNNHLNGWIVGYSLAPAEDAVLIEFVNSAPLKDILWLDENLLDGQKTIDEREPVEEFYSEG